MYSITLATRTMTSYGLSQIVNVEIIVRLTRVKSLLAISNEASKKVSGLTLLLGDSLFLLQDIPVFYTNNLRSNS
ncbi:hypothetical protein VCR4J5_1240058 [Vibrio crassostreae]|uniref:Uncharacterized protein n=1 Tax=Vibrio crassostreae TaxID=246167 RepID=A0ABP1WNU4_9VIBR|nr:hypothetical protein VCR4J5_1240058 [Vibrio crassostreae]CDT28555.1 hypothetical protein VCR20J5_20020 [Vibrio crassostreae]CDT41438.1 hypothetical protein VCR19J5_280029 [Vibrio crassostreae]CDT50706.1 hypothetical protein VCR15J5_660029 [Vibrio crassostreae]CDT58155.1 hypothetical protein VCR9J2_740004 [Vibrio crassostreae]